MTKKQTASLLAAAACAALLAAPATYADTGPTQLVPAAMAPTGSTPARQAAANDTMPAPMTNTPPAELVTNGPQANPGDSSARGSAQRNVTESSQYERQLKTNQGFRQSRMRKECGPISDPDLRQQCLSTFQ